jgi:hypothetical protein
MPQVVLNGVLQDGTRFANQQRHVNALPDECPICHSKIVPENIGAGFLSENFDLVELYFRCVNTKCLRSFISLYERDPTNPAMSYRFMQSVPSQPVSKVLAPEISKLSKEFAKIWAQAQQAEAAGLDDIAGPGYRKALEFLIKDYAISLAADEKEKTRIKVMALQAVIKECFKGDNLHVVSSRAAWLGNDETHYERRWVGKDLQDLKTLIAATEHFIAMELLAAELPTSMPDPKTVIR